jgi:hypothetical protein
VRFDDGWRAGEARIAVGQAGGETVVWLREITRNPRLADETLADAAGPEARRAAAARACETFVVVVVRERCP